MRFVEAVGGCFRRYADFSGRAGRPEYWWFFLFTVLVTAGAGLVDEGMDAGGGGVVSAVVGLGILIPHLAVTVRRLHDTGRGVRTLLLPALVLVASAVMVAAVTAAGLPHGWVRASWIVAGVATGAAQLALLVWLASPSVNVGNAFDEPERPSRTMEEASPAAAPRQGRGPVEAVRVSLHKYATFSGRARRPEYWWFVLFTLLVGAVTSALDAAIGAAAGESGPVASLAVLVLALPTLSVAWRRLHDVGRPGWVFFLPTLVLLIGFRIAAAVADHTGQQEFSASFPLSSDEPSRVEGFETALVMVVVLVLWGAANLLLLYWLASRSQPGPNRFGPEPPAA